MAVHLHVIRGKPLALADPDAGGKHSAKGQIHMEGLGLNPRQHFVPLTGSKKGGHTVSFENCLLEHLTASL